MHVLVGVSGGADSVALLLMLRERGDLRLTAAHFEHGIRGADSLRDAAFVRALCKELGVPLIESSADVPALARARRVGIEQAARDARRAFLSDAKARCGADAIALAHHRGDQAETVLMHIARGAGLRGAAGMAEWDGDIWRPLIRLSKAEILAYLEERSQAHCEDATNADAGTPRNAVRLQVLPALERTYPGAEAALARFSEIARAEDELVAGLAAAFWAAHGEKTANGARVRVVEGTHTAILRRVLSMGDWARMLSSDFSTIDRLVDLYRAHKGKLSLSPPLTAERTGAHLYLIDETITPPAPVPLETAAAITMTPCEPAPKNLGPSAQIVDAAALAGAVLRCRRPGDRFHMLGATGGRLLSDVMIDKKIDHPLRDFWPLVAVDGEILWAPGIGVSECAKVTRETRFAIRLRYENGIDNASR